MTIAEGLDRALRRTGIPILGVSIGNPTDRATWRIGYAPEATEEQHTAGEALKATYTIEGDTVLADEEVAAKFDGDKMLKAVAIWTAQKLTIPGATAKAEIIAIYKGLPG